MKPIIIITGSAGGVGFTATQFFLKKDFKVIAVDNNFREKFFGADGSVSSKFDFLRKNTDFYNIDIRDHLSIEEIFKQHKDEIKVILHCASQPSHDFAATNVLLDFDINVRATIHLLGITHKYCPDSVFQFMSSNKCYGDLVNYLPLKELETRFEYNDAHFKVGINETMSIDKSGHSFLGAAKAASDIYTQEFGRYYNMPTVCWRAGCITGVSHSGAKEHGFLNYIVKSAVQGTHYIVNGYKCKQVRDEIDFSDLCEAFWEFYINPKAGIVYNIGGGYDNSMSILETIKYLDSCGYKLDYSIEEKARLFDHIVYYTDLSKFKTDFPNWKITKTVTQMIDEMITSCQQ